MKKKSTIGSMIRKTPVNLFVFGMGVLLVSCVTAVAGCVVR